jgi:flagellar biosynthesis/type III secretory pathway protein FliH
MSSAAPSYAGLASLYSAMLPSPPEPEYEPEPAIDVEAIADDAYRAGFVAGVAQAEAEFQPERTLLATATAALFAASIIDPDTVRPVFLSLAKALAESVVAAELLVNPAVISRLVDTALVSVETRDGIVVRLHPDDIGAISLDLPVVANPTLTRGTVVIDGPGFVVRDGLDARLAVIVEGLA